MGGKGSGGWHGGGRPRKNAEKKEKEFRTKEPDAVDWLKRYPEDIPMAKENLAYRDKGFDNDGVRQLFAAISLRACCDYKIASRGGRVDNKAPAVTMEDCHKFFSSDIFQYFVNRIPVEEIERYIRSTPDDAINSIWKLNQNNQKKVEE